MLLVEQLVGEARKRHVSGMDERERIVLAVSASLMIAAAAAILVLLPNDRGPVDLVLVAGLLVAYVVAERVRFEFGVGYGTAEQLVIVPLLLLAPLPLVPILIAGANIAAIAPELSLGAWHRERWLGRIADCWFIIPPVLVLAALAPGTPDFGATWVYALAFAAQLAGDFTWTLVRNLLLDGVTARSLLGTFAGTCRVDAILAPVAVMVTVPAADAPYALLVLGPLVWLFHSFARDREERYSKTLELHRAYRGTVMMLSDVAELDDPYTADHSRSLVDQVQAVGLELGLEESRVQRLEFTALLHDIGKLAIPKAILNKPAKLSPDEFELLKTHTIEGQYMLDRVGGMLGEIGEIVRSCHERWDGAGYPDGLSGNEIPTESRIVFACDAYNAMTTNRVYRPARTHDQALAELHANAGTQFDPDVVAALARVLEQRPAAEVAPGGHFVGLPASPPERIRARAAS